MHKISLLIIAALAASALFFLPSLNGKLSGFFESNTSGKKCVAQNGSVYYGEFPKNVVCEKNRSIR